MKKLLMSLALLASLSAGNAVAGDGVYCLHTESSQGTTYLVNTCSNDMEARWCCGGACGLNEAGASSWTIHANSRFPITACKQGEYVRFDGCKGANSLGKASALSVDCRK